MSMGYRIKKARESKKLSRETLAHIVGVTTSAISNYENDISSPKEPILIMLIEALGVDANYFFQDEIAKIKRPPSDELKGELEQHINEINTMKMGDTIRMLREQKNMTQEELGALIGVKKAAIQKYESAKVENIKKKNIKILADFFGVTPSYILGYQKQNTPEAEANEVSEKIIKLMKTIEGLPEQEQEKVWEYIDFLKSKHTE